VVRVEKRGSWGSDNCGGGYSAAKKLAGGGSCGIEKGEIPKVMEVYGNLERCEGHQVERWNMNYILINTLHEL